MRSILLTLIVLVGLSASAQRSNELGFFFGGSYYTGELNPAGHFNSMTRPAGGFAYRHNFNLRLAVAASVMFGSVQGIDARSTSAEQQKRNLSFRSRLYEVSGRIEFNFVEYQIGSELHEFTPFMFAGAALFNFNPRASIGGTWVALQPLKTEGQTKGYMRTQLSLPFGAGVRANVAKRIGLLLEWGLRKTFTDYIDDVSTVYADPALLFANGGSMAVLLGDRSTTATDNIGRQRGNPRAKDWYAYAGLTITFQLRDKPKQCVGIGI
jgi:opacity protein-like surface antigen